MNRYKIIEEKLIDLVILGQFREPSDETNIYDLVFVVIETNPRGLVKVVPETGLFYWDDDLTGHELFLSHEQFYYVMEAVPEGAPALDDAKGWDRHLKKKTDDALRKAFGLGVTNA